MSSHEGTTYMHCNNTFDGLVMAPAEQAIALHDAVASTEVGVLDKLDMNQSTGSLSAKWAIDSSATALVVAEFEREPEYTLDSFLSCVQTAEDSTCAILISVAHRIQGTKRVHITSVDTKPVVVISRAFDDPIPAFSLMQYGLTILHGIVTSYSRACASANPDEAEEMSTAAPVQDWESEEGKQLMEAMLEYKQTRDRFPEKSTFHGRFMRSLPDSVQEFAAYSESTYAIVKERIRESEKSNHPTSAKKRKLDATVDSSTAESEHAASSTNEAQPHH